MNERTNPETGEITTDQQVVVIDTAMTTAIVKAELDTRITTAHAFPRSMQMATRSILSLATLNEKIAAEMMYALARGNKPIRGASIRLAEIVVQCWGNCVSESRVIAVDRVNKKLTAEGVFTDLETNATSKSTVERGIADKRGRLYSEDMITVTGNAARSIARRNAIFAGVPKAVWGQAYEAAEECVAGNVATVAVTRDKAIKAFAVYGLKPEQVFKLIDVKGEQDIGIDEVLTLRALFSSIKNGEATVEELLTGAARGSTNFERVANPLQDDAAIPRRKASPAPATSAVATDSPAAATTQQQEEGGGEQSVAEGAADAGLSRRTSEQIGDDSAAATDPIAVAHERGRLAKVNGHQRKALPTEYRTPERVAEAKAWQAGFDEDGML